MATAAELAREARDLAELLASPTLAPHQILDAMGRLGRVRRLVDGVGVDLAGDLDQRMPESPGGTVSSRLGEASPVRLIELHVGLDRVEARRWYRVGAALAPRVALTGEVLPDAHPALAEAVAGARIGIAAADLILRTLDDIAPHASLDELLDVERFLVGEVPNLTARQIEIVASSVVDRFDPSRGEPREDLQRQLSGVRVTRTRAGLIRWIIDMHPEAAGFLTTAVDARTAPRRQPTFVDASAGTGSADAEPSDAGPADAEFRPLSERRLDALVALARESLQHDHGQVAGTAVTMVVTVPLETLLTGLGTARIAGIDEPISASTARRLSVDAEIIPAVLGGESELLDQGRAQRLGTEAQRRAAALRDDGCIWTGCSVPPAWCEMAHIVPWLEGGATDLDNVALMCPFHHRRFDRDEWSLETRGTERWLIPPPWVDPGRRPRRAGRLPEYVREPCESGGSAAQYRASASASRA